MERVFHTILPVYDKSSRVLILGTMPSPKSREAGFYYAHPQNRFWRTLAAVFGEAVPEGISERREFVLRHRIALWDVLESCEIEGAADSSIKDPCPNDIAGLVAKTNIRHIFTTGAAAYRLYCRYCAEETHIDAVALPSTSAANAGMKPDVLIDKYRVILNVLKGD